MGRVAHTAGAGGAADPAALADELARLSALDLAALRLAFRNRTGRIAPVRASRALLLRALSYRVQADAQGDLRPDTRRMLDRLASVATAEVAGAGPPAALVYDLPRRGTVLVREWRGRRVQVTVVEGGFSWDGACYPSLSAAALAITGTKWNGRRFFGLDRPAGGPVKRAGEPGRDGQAARPAAMSGPASRRGGAPRPARSSPPAGAAP